MPDSFFSPQNILHILEIVAIVFGGFGVAFQLGKTTERIETAIVAQVKNAERQGTEMTELRSEIKKLNDVLTTLAVQETRLDMHDKWIDELRRGVGLISKS
jgi:hypothetical protein